MVFFEKISTNSLILLGFVEAKTNLLIFLIPSKTSSDCRKYNFLLIFINLILIIKTT